MFDLPPAIETHCGTEVAELVQHVDSRGTDNTQKVQDVYWKIGHTNIANSCQDSLMTYFMSLVDGQQSDEYIDSIINYVIDAAEEDYYVYPNTRELIKEKIPLIEYKYTPSFSKNYFYLLIKLNYPINDRIRNLDVTNDKEQLWNKNLYLAHRGDFDAIEYLRAYLHTIEPAQELLDRIEKLRFINRNIRDSLLSDFSQDSRSITVMESDGTIYERTISGSVKIYMEFF